MSIYALLGAGLRGCTRKMERNFKVNKGLRVRPRAQASARMID